jgi:hypothetical protein
MERFVETMLRPSPRIVRQWQCLVLIFFCVAQQGCMCGCAHPVSCNPYVVAKAGSDIRPHTADCIPSKFPIVRMESEL